MLNRWLSCERKSYKILLPIIVTKLKINARKTLFLKAVYIIHYEVQYFYSLIYSVQQSKEWWNQKLGIYKKQMYLWPLDKAEKKKLYMLQRNGKSTGTLKGCTSTCCSLRSLWSTTKIFKNSSNFSRLKIVSVSSHFAPGETSFLKTPDYTVV